MLVKQFRLGGDRNFSYLAGDEVHKKAVVIDPAFCPEKIVDFAREKGYGIEYIFNTHGHFDHTSGNDRIEVLTGKRPLSYGSRDPETGKAVEDGARFPLGEPFVSIIHTPGHTSDSICILVGDALFTGDTLFVGKVGGTDFGSGARAEYESLHKKLLSLPDNTRVFPGHDYGLAPESTIGKERKKNPFLLQPDFKAFVHLKRNWEAYKREHGIP